MPKNKKVTSGDVVLASSYSVNRHRVTYAIANNQAEWHPLLRFPEFPASQWLVRSAPTPLPADRG